jgi:hypothetical protein
VESLVEAAVLADERRRDEEAGADEALNRLRPVEARGVDGLASATEADVAAL